MRTQTASEIISTVFFSLAASGGEDFKRHAGHVINDVLGSGIITDPAARKYLAKLAQIAEQKSEPALPA
jgi:hypothetical protein